MAPARRPAARCRTARGQAANGKASPRRSIAPPTMTIPISEPRKNAEKTQPYSSMPPSSRATCGITVETASASKATSVIVRTSPIVRERRSVDQRPSTMGTGCIAQSMACARTVASPVRRRRRVPFWCATWSGCHAPSASRRRRSAARRSPATRPSSRSSPSNAAPEHRQRLRPVDVGARGDRPDAIADPCLERGVACREDAAGQDDVRCTPGQRQPADDRARPSRTSSSASRSTIDAGDDVAVRGGPEHDRRQLPQPRLRDGLRPRSRG